MFRLISSQIESLCIIQFTLISEAALYSYFYLLASIRFLNDCFKIKFVSLDFISSVVIAKTFVTNLCCVSFVRYKAYTEMLPRRQRDKEKKEKQNNWTIFLNVHPRAYKILQKIT